MLSLTGNHPDSPHAAVDVVLRHGRRHTRLNSYLPLRRHTRKHQRRSSQIQLLRLLSVTSISALLYPIIEFNLRITHYFNIYLTICFSYLKNIILINHFKYLYNLKIITNFAK